MYKEVRRRRGGARVKGKKEGRTAGRRSAAPSALLPRTKAKGRHRWMCRPVTERIGASSVQMCIQGAIDMRSLRDGTQCDHCRVAALLAFLALTDLHHQASRVGRRSHGAPCGPRPVRFARVHVQ